jgi:glycosyltransferase involved in cell wall biosynthesis
MGTSTLGTFCRIPAQGTARPRLDPSVWYRAHSAQVREDGSSRFTALVHPSLVATDAGSLLLALERDGGVDAELRVLVDEQLASDEVFIDLAPTFGFAGFTAATVAQLSSRVAFVATSVDEAEGLLATADACGVAERVTVLLGDDTAAEHLPSLLREAGMHATTPHWIRAATAVDALHLAHWSSTGAAVRVIAWPWHPDDRDAGATRVALEQAGFAAMVLAADESGDVSLMPATYDAPMMVFSLSAAFVARLTATPPTTVGIEWQVGATTGWQVYGQNLLRAISERGITPVLMGGVAPSGLDADTLAIAREAETRYTTAAAGARAQHAVLTASFPVLTALGNSFASAPRAVPLQASCNVGVIFFEDTHLDAQARTAAARFTHIVTGSRWNEQVLRRNGITHVSTVLQGVNPVLFHPQPRAREFGDRFVIFAGGKLEYRKGQDLVVAAFREFHARHPESLLVTAWHNAWPDSMNEIGLAAHVDGPPIVRPDDRADFSTWFTRNDLPPGAAIDIGLVPNARMARLFASVDCALFPNRCEGGTNLVAMEAMASGVPVILSANTGHLDLIDADRCIPLQAQGTPRQSAQFRGQDEWGESAVDEMVQALEQLHSDAALRRAIGTAGAAFMRGLSWERQTATLIDLLATLS